MNIHILQGFYMLANVFQKEYYSNDHQGGVFSRVGTMPLEFCKLAEERLAKIPLKQGSGVWMV